LGHTVDTAAFDVTEAAAVGEGVAGRMISRGRGKIVDVCSVQSELGRTLASGASDVVNGQVIYWGRRADQRRLRRTAFKLSRVVAGRS